MSKKTKLSLDDLKVASFITSLDKQKETTIKGGSSSEYDPPLDGTVVVTHDASCHGFCN